MLGAKLILTSPKGDVEYVVWFKFPVTNNETKYEVLIAGLKIAKEVGVLHLTTFSDSQLMVGQVKDECKAREENMKKYLDKVKDLIMTFQGFDVQ